MSSTFSTRIEGTPLYMAPEQMRGGRPDPRSDIWAMGVVLYEALSGQPPFTGRTQLEVAAAVLKETPARLPTDIPQNLVRIIERCLCKEPVQRFQRALEMLRSPQGNATTGTYSSLGAGLSWRIVRVR